MTTLASDQGFIVRTRPYSETSQLISWLTLEHGRITTLARGSRRPKSSFAGKLDLFHFGHLTFRLSSRSQLHTLQEVMIIDYHLDFRRNWHALQHLAYAAALIERATETDTPIPAFYNLFASTAARLAAAPPDRLSLWMFECQLLALHGVPPHLYLSQAHNHQLPIPRPLEPGVLHLLEALATVDSEKLTSLRPTARQKLHLEHVLRAILQNQFGRLPKQRPLNLQ